MNNFKKTFLLTSALVMFGCSENSNTDPQPELPPPPPVNSAPVANNDTATVKANTSTTIDVLRNDSDQDGERLTVTKAEGAEFGTVAIEDNKVVYTPIADFTGDDMFTYVASDGNAVDSAQVVVTVED